MFGLLGIAVYIILWWLSFFVMLPIGARSHYEAGEPPPPGSEHGAPLAHGIKFKALVAAAIAVPLWGLVYWAVSVNLFDPNR